MQTGEAIGVAEPCYWLCISQGAAYSATTPAPGLTPPTHTPSQNKGILEDWHAQLYAKPEVSQQVVLLKTI